jgi:hypothetical protein
MPRRAVDYSKTVIYKIQHNEDESLLYIGSTTDFTNRKSQHKCACNNETIKDYHRKVYRMIRENGGWDCFTMVKIEDFPCVDGRDAEAREDELMRQMNANMNANRAFIEDPAEQRRVYDRRYLEAHPERRTETLRLYRENHHQEILERARRYRETNHEFVNRTHRCEICDVHVLRKGLNRHQQTEKHINNQRILDEANQ